MGAEQRGVGRRGGLADGGWVGHNHCAWFDTVDDLHATSESAQWSGDRDRDRTAGRRDDDCTTIYVDGPRNQLPGASGSDAFGLSGRDTRDAAGPGERGICL